MATHRTSQPPTFQQALATRPAGQARVLLAIAAITLVAIGVLFAIYGDRNSGASTREPASSPSESENDPADGTEGVAINNTRPERPPTAEDRSDFKLADIRFDGAAAYDYLKKICALGSRTSGTAGMKKQQDLLIDHFKKLGAKIELQKFQMRHPITGAIVPLVNLIVTWHPDRRERVLLCAHYDTRPYPDEEPDRTKRRALFVGANDGASGVALLMQLGKEMPKLGGDVGVDFVFFDAEELIYGSGPAQRGQFFVGSQWFATEYRRSPPRHRYRAGILLDMVGDAELHLYKDRASLAFEDARPIVDQVWDLAKQLKVREFIHAKGWQIEDDHLMLNQIAGIPTIDIIDFDYPRPGEVNYWHTTKDVPENCSALSLAKVGWVVHEWLKRLK